MAQNKETREVQNPALLAVGQRDDVLIWRQMVGTFRAYTNPNRIIKVGNAGDSDAMSVVKVTITPDMVGKTIGVAVAAEFKVPKTGRLSEDQKSFRDAFEKRGGTYAVVRCEQDMIDLVERVQRGDW